MRSLHLPKNRAIAPTLPPNKPIGNHQKIINFMAQSFWHNLFNFKSAIAAATITAAIAIATPTKALDQPFPSREIPQSVTNLVLANAAQQLGLPVADIRIVSSQPVIWPDGCMGLYAPNIACTMVLFDGWIVTVESAQQRLVYHTSLDTARLASSSNTNTINQPPLPPPTQPNPNPITPPISTPRQPGWRCPTQFPNRCQPWIPEQPGASQQNPIMPTVTRPNWWEFINVRAGNWVDPPTAYGFRYQMTSDSLFTEIIDFPTGFANPFTVLVKDTILGEFTAGNSVKFSNYSTLLGDLLVSDRGVKEFSIIGLNVDPTNPTAFPLQIDFNTDTANFNMYPLLNQESQSVPEPSAILGLLTSSAFLIRITRKRQQKLLD